MQAPHSLWWSQLDQPVVERSPLVGDLEFDVAIVGGGFTGLWTARELVRRDPSLRVAILERSVCGFGASGRNGGWASALYPLSEGAVIARHGRDASSHLHHELARAVSDLGEAIAGDHIDAHYVRGGTLTFARSDVQSARLQASVNEARSRGVTPEELKWLNQAAARDVGDVAGALGATYASQCARIHPAKLVRGLADVVERLGVTIFERTTVTQMVAATPSRSAHVVTPQGTLSARYVVRATEGFTPTLSGHRRTVAPLYSLMIATAPQSAAFWHHVGFQGYETFADDRHLIIYGQRTNDDRIAFGGRGAPYHFGSNVKQRYDTNPKVFRLLESTLRELFPDLEGAITHRWGGPLAMPRDLSPSVLVEHRLGLASAGGYTGDGVVLSYVAGNALADLMHAPDDETRYTRLPFVGHRSKAWEVEPLRWLGINVGLGLASWSDHTENRRHRESRASHLLDRLFNQFPP